MTIRALLASFSDRLLSDFDRLVIGPESLDVSKLNFEAARSTVDIQETSLSRLDAKAGSTLTHISMMAAAATFVISGESSSVAEQIIIAVELGCYLFAALCCLRCLIFRERMFDPHTQGNLNPAVGLGNYGLSIAKQVWVFGRLLNFAVRLTFFVTFLFALSLIAHIAL